MLKDRGVEFVAEPRKQPWGECNGSLAWHRRPLPPEQLQQLILERLALRAADEHGMMHCRDIGAPLAATCDTKTCDQKVSGEARSWLQPRASTRTVRHQGIPRITRPVSTILEGGHRDKIGMSCSRAP